MFFHLTTSSLLEGEYWNSHLWCGGITTGKLDTLCGSICFSDHTLVFCRLYTKRNNLRLCTHIHRYGFEYYLFWLQVWLEVQGSELVLNLNWTSWTSSTRFSSGSGSGWGGPELNWTKLQQPYNWCGALTTSIRLRPQYGKTSAPSSGWLYPHCSFYSWVHLLGSGYSIYWLHSHWYGMDTGEFSLEEAVCYWLRGMEGYERAQQALQYSVQLCVPDKSKWCTYPVHSRHVGIPSNHPL